MLRRINTATRNQGSGAKGQESRVKGQGAKDEGRRFSPKLVIWNEQRAESREIKSRELGVGSREWGVKGLISEFPDFLNS